MLRTFLEYRAPLVLGQIPPPCRFLDRDERGTRGLRSIKLRLLSRQEVMFTLGHVALMAGDASKKPPASRGQGLQVSVEDAHPWDPLKRLTDDDIESHNVPGSAGAPDERKASTGRQAPYPFFTSRGGARDAKSRRAAFYEGAAVKLQDQWRWRRR